MKERTEGPRPHARQAGLVIREVTDEVLVYDLERDKAHCLNRAAALVWKHCDGRTAVPQIAERLRGELQAPVDEQVVWLALDQLGRKHLLQERPARPGTTARLSRREVVRTLGLAAAIALPLVTSIIAPTAAQASTCKAPPASCSSNVECCGPPVGVGVCSGGMCT